jgi:hypothetical protein
MAIQETITDLDVHPEEIGGKRHDLQKVLVHGLSLPADSLPVIVVSVGWREPTKMLFRNLDVFQRVLESHRGRAPIVYSVPKAKLAEAGIEI